MCFVRMAHLAAAPCETRDSDAAFASSAADGVDAVGCTFDAPPDEDLAAAVPWRPEAPVGCLPEGGPLLAGVAALTGDGSSWVGLCAFCRSALLGACDPPPP